MVQKLTLTKEQLKFLEIILKIVYAIKATRWMCERVIFYINLILFYENQFGIRHGYQMKSQTRKYLKKYIKNTI